MGIMNFREEEMKVEEIVRVRLEDFALSFSFKEPDTLAVLSPSGCYFYKLLKDRVKKERFDETCRGKKGFFYYFGDYIRLLLYSGNRAELYSVQGFELKLDTTFEYGNRILGCEVLPWTIKCFEEKGVFKGAERVYLLSLSDSAFLITYGRTLKVIRRGREVVRVEVERRPIDISYSHGLVHVALGDRGMLTVDAKRGYYTFYRDITAIAVYSSILKFVVLVEDGDGCIHTFKPVFRPPGVRYVRKGKVKGCR